MRSLRLRSEVQWPEVIIDKMALRTREYYVANCEE